MDETIVDNMAGILTQIVNTIQLDSDKYPKKFEIMGTDIEVIKTNDLDFKSGILSRSVFEEGKIYILDYKSNKVLKSIIDRSFYKEVLWFLFKFLSEELVYKNDKLLFSLSSLLVQVFNTIKY